MRRNTGTITLSRFKEEYLSYSASFHTSSSHISARAALNEFERIIGNTQLIQIGVKDIERFIAIKKTERSVFTARRCFVTVAAAFKKAVDWNYLEINPFTKVSKPRLPEVPPKYFTQDDFRALYQSIDDIEFKDLCIVAVYTGMRQGELINLKWDNVDIRERRIHIVNTEEFTTKSKKNRMVPMNEPVHSIFIKRNEAAICSHVFHRRGEKLKKDYVSRKFKKYVLTAGLNDRLNFHSLRHTCASWLVQKDVSLYVVQQILGHSSITVTEKYAHLGQSQMHKALEKLLYKMNMNN